MPGTSVSVPGLSSQDRSFSDAGLQVLQDLEAAEYNKEGESSGDARHLTIPGFNQNAALFQHELLNLGSDVMCIRADGTPFVTRNKNLMWQFYLQFTAGLPAVIKHGERGSDAELKPFCKGWHARLGFGECTPCR